jgi:DNA adenine methylase
VLLAKSEASQETVCDLHGDLLNLARVIRDDALGAKLYRRLRRTLVHEGLFGEAETAVAGPEWSAPADDADPKGIDLDRAYQYFVAGWLGRNGVIGTTKGSCGKQFAVRYTSNGGIQGVRFAAAVNSIPAWRRRMRRVTMLRRDGMQLLERIEDDDGTCIYVDPPYVEKGAEYVHDFADGDHARLAELLRRFERARVVVSYYAHPSLAALYPDWTVIDCAIAKALGNQGQRGRVSKQAPEVLLINGPSLSQQGDLFGG